MEKPHTGLDECLRILLSCFRARNSARHGTQTDTGVLLALRNLMCRQLQIGVETERRGPCYCCCWGFFIRLAEIEWRHRWWSQGLKTKKHITLQLYINIEHRDDLRMIGYYALCGSNISSSANGSSDPIVAVVWQDMRSAGHLLKLVFSLSLSLSRAPWSFTPVKKGSYIRICTSPSIFCACVRHVKTVEWVGGHCWVKTR